MNVKFLRSAERKELLAELEEIYGLTELNEMLIETGKRKIRAFSGELTKEELLQIAKYVNIELIGMYLLSKKDEDARLNFDVVSLLRDKITRSKFNVTKEQLDLWIRGNDLNVEAPKGIVVIEYEGDLVGVGKSNGTTIYNYVPKERKLKTPVSSVKQRENGD